MGRQALVSHASTNEHKTYMGDVTSFFEPRATSSKSVFSSENEGIVKHGKKQSTLEVVLNNVEKTKAEMWTLMCVTAGY